MHSGMTNRNGSKDLLPGQPGKAGANAKDNCLFVEAMLYRYRAGIPWRDLPLKHLAQNRKWLVSIALVPINNR